MTGLKLQTSGFRGNCFANWSGITAGYDSAALLVLNNEEIYKFGKIQTSQTGG